MNNLTDQLNAFLSSETFFQRQSIDWINGSIQLFIVFPITSIGVILNIIAFLIVTQIKEHHLFLFRVLKLMCLNSTVLNLLFVFSFYKDSSRYIGYRYDLFERIVECIFFPFFNSLFYWADTVIDILLSIERLSIFLKQFKIITKSNPYIFYAFTLIICSILNLPSLLRSYPRTDSDMFQVLVNSMNSSIPIKRCIPGPTDTSPLILVNILLRDIISLIAQISSSLLVLYYFMRFQTKKALLQHTIGEGVHTHSHHSSHRQESRLSILTLSISALSLVNHLAVGLLFTFNYMYRNPQVIGYIAIVSSVTVVVKNTSNFFILYYINTKFKKTVLSFIYRSKFADATMTEQSVQQTHSAHFS